MAQVNNLRIITEFGELVYLSAESLNITFNRIVDDFTDISNRFADFTYEFDLPIVKENSQVFSFANALIVKNIFNINRNISCQVYLNNQLLLDGLINLESISQTSYRCKLYSKFKELIDSLNEIDPNTNEQKTLRSLKFPVIENWHYEESIIDHINAYGDKDSDSTTHQHALCFYSTNYCQTSYFSGHTDIQGNYFESDRDKQNFYYLLNSIGGDENRVYMHQLPPQIYIVRIVEQILTDAGWKLGGQFFNNKDVKRIVLTYAGDEDIYDQATEQVSGSTELNLQIAKFLPDTNQAQFLKDIINYFNLYFKIDVNNKIVEFETYDTYFNNTTVNPYDITNNVLLDTVETNYIPINNPTIKFDKPNNGKIMGDNYIMTGATDNAYEQQWITGSSINFNQTFNRVGTSGDISIGFSSPTIKKHYIYNNINVDGTNNSAEMQLFYLPLLSKQTMNDNNSMKFNKKDIDTYVFNNESTIKFAGEGTLMYHYGFPTTTFENKTGKGSLADYLYVNIYTGVTTLNRVPITICSPWQLLNYREAINSWLDSITPNNISDRRTTIATYLQTIWQMMGTATSCTDNVLTDFSLVFDDNGYFHNTLWTKFHKNKWDRYANSKQVTATMFMNAYDWQEMQINRPILYRQELYSMIAIEGYNPITRTAVIKLIKKL